jgi:hypothetical protein
LTVKQSIVVEHPHRKLVAVIVRDVKVVRRSTVPLSLFETPLKSLL